jgi:hypothetical protein
MSFVIVVKALLDICVAVLSNLCLRRRIARRQAAWQKNRQIG